VSEQLDIDPDFEAALRPLSDEEFRHLEKNIVSVGKVIDPIIAWGDKIIDGMNRYKIAVKHGLEFHVVRLDFESKDAVIKWMHRNQVGRRNLAGLGLVKTRAAIAAALEEEDGQSLVAESLHISPRTLRDNKRTSAIMQTIPGDLEQMLAAGEIKATAKDLRQLADIPIEDREPIYADWMVTGSLREAMVCNRSGVSGEQLELLIEKIGSVRQFSPVINRIRTGSIAVTQADIDKFMGLPDGTKQLVSCILLEEPKSLGNAMETLDISTGVTVADKLKKSAADIERAVGALVERLKTHSGISGHCYKNVASIIRRGVGNWLEKEVTQGEVS
jgi:hypothetical protein